MGLQTSAASIWPCQEAAEVEAQDCVFIRGPMRTASCGRGSTTAICNAKLVCTWLLRAMTIHVGLMSAHGPEKGVSLASIGLLYRIATTGSTSEMVTDTTLLSAATAPQPVLAFVSGPEQMRKASSGSSWTDRCSLHFRSHSYVTRTVSVTFAAREM